MRTRLLRRTIGTALIGVLGVLAPAPCRAQPLLHPYSVALDSFGNVYVTQLERHTVKTFDANGVFRFEWGGRGSGDGQFESPLGIVVEPGGNAVYVADSGNHRIQKFDTTGRFVSAWGTFGNQPGEFRRPTAIAADAGGHVLVTDSVTRRIQVFRGSDGLRVRHWEGSVGAGDGQFSAQGPQGIAVDAGGNILVADRGNHRIMRFDPTGVFLGWGGKCTGGSNCTNFSDPSKGRSVGFTCTQMLCSPGPLGNSGEGDGQFTSPTGLSATSDGVYVTDGNDRIQFLNAQGFQRKWGSTGSGSGQLRSPLGVAAVAAGASVYVADSGNNRIQRFDAAGLPQTAWGGADIRLNASDGEAPGAVNPITLAGSSVKFSTITVTSLSQFAGPVDLSVWCCQGIDALNGRSPGTVARLSAAQVMVPAGGSASARLDLSGTSLGSPGKWVSVVTARNTALSIERVQGVVFTVPQRPGAAFSLTAAPGPSPGLGDLFTTMTGRSKIAVNAIGPFDGRVSLGATCCVDVLSGRTVGSTGITATLSQQSVDLGPGSQGTSTLTVRTANPPSFGKFLVPVTATHEGIRTRSGTVAFTVLPPAIAGPTSCRPASLQTVSMHEAVKALIRFRETPPPGPNVTIGFTPTMGPPTAVRWAITVAADPLLTDGGAMIVLDNQTGDSKEITTGGGCGSRGISILAPKNTTSSMMIIRPLTERTIVFRQQVGSEIAGNRRWEDVFVMSETAFWLVFGGRRTTFTWLQ